MRGMGFIVAGGSLLLVAIATGAALAAAASVALGAACGAVAWRVGRSLVRV